MFRPIIKTLVVMLTAASLGACTGANGSKEHGGTLLGAALGGLAGSKVGRGRGPLAAVAGNRRDNTAVNTSRPSPSAVALKEHTAPLVASLTAAGGWSTIPASRTNRRGPMWCE